MHRMHLTLPAIYGPFASEQRQDISKNCGEPACQDCQNPEGRQPLTDLIPGVPASDEICAACTSDQLLANVFVSPAPTRKETSFGDTEQNSAKSQCSPAFHESCANENGSEAYAQECEPVRGANFGKDQILDLLGLKHNQQGLKTHARNLKDARLD